MEILNASANLWRVGGLTLYLIVVYIAFNIWDHYLGMLTMVYGHQISYDVKMRLGDKLRKLPLGFFVRKPTGELNTVMSEYVSRAEQFISYSAPFMLSSLAAASALMIFFLLLNWRMALAATSTIPLAIARALNHLISRRAYPYPCSVC